MRGAILRSLGLSVLVLSGCAENPYTVQNKNASQQQQLALQQRNTELQSRAATLDQDNQELETLLAQARQHNKLVEDQLVAVRDQLSATTSQLAQVREEKQLTEKQTEAIVASTKRRAGAMITTNSSLERSLPVVNLPGVEVRQDGDVVRVELPAAQLFQNGTTNLQPTGTGLLDTVGAELARAYPDQIIGIEGHTEGDQPGTAGWATNQQLSLSRALVVYQQLGTRGPLRPAQLFTVGHGGNHPVVSNATPNGRQRNNRVELVIYPEKVAGH